MKKIIYLALLVGILTVFGVASSSFAATESFSQHLGYGSRGSEVSKLQQFLIDGGFLKISAPTGNYLTLTRDAVKAFQKSRGIINTGYFGPLTLAAANSTGASIATTPPKSSISLLSVTSANSNPAAIFLANSKNIRWQANEYPNDAGVNINLLRKVSNSPIKYDLVRQIAVNTPNDGEATWNPSVSENFTSTGSNLYIEVTCSTSVQFDEGCRVDGGPIKAL